eukprot:UN16962
MVCEDENSYCHASDGCIPYGVVGDGCQVTTPPEVQYLCREELICIPDSNMMGSPGVCGTERLTVRGPGNGGMRPT